MAEPLDLIRRRSFVGAGGLAGLVALGGLVPFAEAQSISAADKANIEAVKAFSAGWKAHDPAMIVSPFTENCAVRWTAQRMDAPPVMGKDAFLNNVQNALRDQTIEMIVIEMFAQAPMVINCHHQLFDSKKTGQREDLYIGIFFFENGKIREWNDSAVFDPRPRTPHSKDFGKFAKATIES